MLTKESTVLDPGASIEATAGRIVDKEGGRVRRGAVTLQRTLVAMLLLLFGMMGLNSIVQKSVTVDEIVYIAAGYSYLRTHDYRMNRDHPPLMKMIAGVPLLFLNPTLPTDHYSWREWRWDEYESMYSFGDQFLYSANNNADQLVFWARIPIMAIGILLGVYVFLFARELYGVRAGYFALVLYCFSPNILAHTTLATTDIGVTCFSFISIYYLRRYFIRRQKSYLWLTGIFLGTSLAAKFSALYLMPSFVIVGGFLAYKERGSRPFDDAPYDGYGVGRLFSDLTVMFSIALGVVILSYGIMEFPVFVEGLILLFRHNARGHPAFLMGEHSMTGWPQYFLVAFAVKTPLALVILIGGVTMLYRHINDEPTGAVMRDLILIIPVAVMLGAAMMSRLNIGIRHILPIYPFLFVYVSQFINWKANIGVKYGTVCALVGWYGLSSVAIAPHYLAYFNELVGGPGQGYRYLIDSNIDWGQDLKALSLYMKERKLKKIKLAFFGTASCAYRGIECEELACTPQAGILAVSVNRLVGLTEKQSRCFAWLREFTPVEKIGYSIFVYEIKKEEMGTYTESYTDKRRKRGPEYQIRKGHSKGSDH